MAGSRASEKWKLVLYVSGESAKMKAAIENLERICDDDLKGECSFEVIDIRKHPELAAKEGIFATPTLVRKLPPSVSKIVGDLSHKEKVLVGLEIKIR